MTSDTLVTVPVNPIVQISTCAPTVQVSQTLPVKAPVNSLSSTSPVQSLPEIGSNVVVTEEHCEVYVDALVWPISVTDLTAIFNKSCSRQNL